MVKPEARKQAVDHMITEHNLSERTACQLASVSRTGYRYQSKARNDDDRCTPSVGQVKACNKELFSAL